MIEVLLLAASISLSAGRSIFSKKISAFISSGKLFFLFQGFLFLLGLVAILFFDFNLFNHVSPPTITYGLIYGLLLIGSQWLFTLALNFGTASTCTMVYSFGFIIPTICGFIFWNEAPTVWKIIGIVLVFPLIIFVSLTKEKTKTKSNLYLIPLILSALCSGGLGIMQKVQQQSVMAQEKTAFLFIGFLFATLFSFVVYLIMRLNKRHQEQANWNNTGIIFSVGAGLCFGLANMINTMLAALVPATILFPVFNIGVILLTTILGLLIFKEKPHLFEYLAFAVGVTAIVLLII
ncbi:MAG: EamA family transporter [Bacilli bacterium]|jgi:drug/metabolite transporter (DMT)-like permease